MHEQKPVAIVGIGAIMPDAHDAAAGRPLELPPDLAGGHGLAGLRERVHLAGGTFDASAEGDGFVTTAALPARSVGHAPGAAVAASAGGGGPVEDASVTVSVAGLVPPDTGAVLAVVQLVEVERDSVAVAQPTGTPVPYALSLIHISEPTRSY